MGRMSALDHIDIITALMRREIAIRFGQERLSYLWAFIVPLSWIGFGIVAFAAFDRVIPITAHPALFLATGILPYVIFRQTLTYVTRASVAAQRIQDMPLVTFAHLLVAFAILEALTTALLSVLVLLGLMWLAGLPAPADPLALAGVFGLTWALGVVCAVFTSLLARLYSAVTRLLPLLLRPFFWISGVFFVATELPSEWQAIFTLNPLFPLIDGARDAAFDTYTSPVFTTSKTLSVVFALTLAFCLLFSLKAFRARRLA